MELTLVLGISILALAFAGWLTTNVLRNDTGTPEMQSISNAIKEGAEAFMRRQYKTIAILSVVVAMSLLGVGGLFTLLNAIGGIDPKKIPFMIVGYGFGASFVALFAQLGGGIYTKAADVGADLVGKVEAGIPEDDPRNPAVIADLVGDNVGDCAGRGADLFESTAAENIGAMILGAALSIGAAKAGYTFALGTIGVMLFPLVARSFGLIASIIGIVAVRTTETEDPMKALNRGYYIASFLGMVGFWGATRWLLHTDAAPAAWWHFALCGTIGILTAQAFVFITQY